MDEFHQLNILDFQLDKVAHTHKLKYVCTLIHYLSDNASIRKLI